MSRKLLLIVPRYPQSFWSLHWTIRNIRPERRTINPPLGLATLAALCPPDWDVSIIDENVEAIPRETDADVVGICGMGVQFGRQSELFRYYRHRGHYCVAGGSYASLRPELYHDLADTVVAGEAEYIWPRFCRDFEGAAPLPLYQESGDVDLGDSPTPRFDLLQLNKYRAGTVQFSRGCPHRCDFCDIIVMFGRKPRVKSIDQVRKELDRLRTLNVTEVFFIDDNFIGHRPAVKSLLRFLADYQRRHSYPFRFGTEASLDLALDGELLGLLRDANFGWVFLGIESGSADSLRDASKFQNLRMSAIDAVRRIYSHGLSVHGGFIVGFDNDDLSCFRAQHDLIMQSGIQLASISLLNAIPRTPPYLRLQRENRLTESEHAYIDNRVGTNVVPKRMSYEDMVRMFPVLYRVLFSDRNIYERIRTKALHFRAQPDRCRYPLMDSLGSAARLVSKGILAGGLRRTIYFVRTLTRVRPRDLQWVFTDWALGLGVQDFVEKHLVPAVKSADGYLAGIDWIGTRTQDGVQVRVRRCPETTPTVVFRFEKAVTRRLRSRILGQIVSVLSQTPMRVTLDVAAMSKQDLARLNPLLHYVSAWGDRVQVLGDPANGIALDVPTWAMDWPLERGA